MKQKFTNSTSNGNENNQELQKNSHLNKFDAAFGFIMKKLQNIKGYLIENSLQRNIYSSNVDQKQTRVPNFIFIS